MKVIYGNYIIMTLKNHQQKLSHSNTENHQKKLSHSDIEIVSEN
jgi:5,10-methylene-tetrahydrofolate dehydrogenase/methenyl tetrahydrofolate cyclohydrolase